MFNRIRVRLMMVLKVLRAHSVHVIFQDVSGSEPRTLGIGRQDLADLVLFSVHLKTVYDGFIDMVNEVAAESGDLHALQQLRDAVAVIEKEARNVRD